MDFEHSKDVKAATSDDKDPEITRRLGRKLTELSDLVYDDKSWFIQEICQTLPTTVQEVRFLSCSFGFSRSKSTRQS